MTDRPVDSELLAKLTSLAQHSSVPLSEMSMDRIAGSLGMTRMTLYRNGGPRANIIAALREHGIDAARPPAVADRVLDAVVNLLREKPLAGITMEIIADRAACSVPAIYDRFGSRQGVLIGLLERHSPLVPLRREFADVMDQPSRGLRHDVYRIYSAVFHSMKDEWPMVRSFIAELLAGPDTDMAKVVRDWYLPQVMNIVVPIFSGHSARGNIRNLPLPIVFQFLIGPMGLHIASRQYLIEHQNFDMPGPEETIDVLTDAFCRAVGTGRDACQ
jgi:AcrR family transcriptional regulator